MCDWLETLWSLGKHPERFIPPRFSIPLPDFPFSFILSQVAMAAVSFGYHDNVGEMCWAECIDPAGTAHHRSTHIRDGHRQWTCGDMRLVFTNDKEWDYSIYFVLQIPQEACDKAPPTSSDIWNYDIMWIDAFEILAWDTLFPATLILCKDLRATLKHLCTHCTFADFRQPLLSKIAQLRKLIGKFNHNIIAS